MGFSTPVPLEVIAYIIENFCHEVSTLHACSLVSHAFLAPTRKILFSLVSLTPKRCPNLSAILAANPSLSFYIREIYIVVPRPLQHPTVKEDAILSLQMILDSLSPSRLRILSMMFGDKSFRLPWYALSVPLRAAVERVLEFPSIETVNFIGVGGLPWNFFSHLNQAKSLILLSVSIDTGEMKSSGDPPDQPLQSMTTATTPCQQQRCLLDRLELSYDFDDERSCLTAFRTTLDLSRLRTFVVLIRNEDPDAIWEILQDSLQSLETFTCYCFFDPFSDNQLPKFEAFSNLRNVHITTDTSFGESALRWLFRILTHLGQLSGDQPVSVEEVILHIERLSKSDFAALMASTIWADLDNILTSPTFANLHKVSVYMLNPPATSWLTSHGFSSDQIECIVHTLTPALHAKGLLEARPTCLDLENILKGSKETYVPVLMDSGDSDSDDEDDEEEEEEEESYSEFSDDWDDDDMGGIGMDDDDSDGDGWYDGY